MTNQHCVELTFEQADQIAILSLNRPTFANAFNSDMIIEITDSIEKVSKNRNCRLLIIRGHGKHFSGGADLNWMKESAKLSYQGNIDDAKTLSNMFIQLDMLDIPSIAVVQGAAFGGAVGLAACCDFVIASENSRFCLSEVKLGLIPAVILPYLLRKVPLGALKRLSLTASLIQGPEALRMGLVESCVKESELDQEIRKVINELLAAGPEAHKNLKTLFRSLAVKIDHENELTAQAIAAARSGKEGQHGLSSFFRKENPSWKSEVSQSWAVVKP